MINGYSAVCLAASLLLGGGMNMARATTLDVTLDTSDLINNPAGPFYVEFQLNDGSGTNDGNNTATITNFLFGSGGPGLTLSTTGGASGSMDSAVTITDNSFFNQFYQVFDPGQTLSFIVSLTNEVDPGPQPDEFTFAILDCSKTEIPTTSPANALLSIDITATPVVQTYRGSPSGVLGCNSATGIPLPAPTVSSAPEPRSVGLSGVGLAILCVLLYLFSRAKSAPSAYMLDDISGH